MSGVIVRLKSGVEGLSRCRIASTEHMFSMGATDISTDVASLCLECRQVTLGKSAAGVDARSRVDDGGSWGLIVMGGWLDGYVIDGSRSDHKNVRKLENQYLPTQ
jgi:hypothetical protein